MITLNDFFFIDTKNDKSSIINVLCILSNNEDMSIFSILHIFANVSNEDGHLLFAISVIVCWLALIKSSNSN